MSSGGKSAAASSNATRIKLGISACLLGEKVRYDSGHKLDVYLTETLGPFIDWVPVCPEVEAGLRVPREPMHLVGAARGPRLVTLQTEIDHTGRMLDWIRGRLPELARENLCGFIFKSRSPSCGMQVEIQTAQDRQDRPGRGIWAGAFMAANPMMPVESEVRLRDAGIREDFIERVLAFSR